jgi:hypothetical protein
VRVGAQEDLVVLDDQQIAVAAHAAAQSSVRVARSFSYL